MIVRKIRAYVEIPVSPTDLKHSVRYAMTITNISLSGCFVKLDQGLELGTPLSFSLPLQGGETLHFWGSVARQQDAPHGYGIIFNAMTEEERRELALLIADSHEVMDL
ncbi:MAG: PilZ domain-containing protein [Acidobacteria bacterium]|nr:PilZ domain-containing protein [Acidobacteriota bacterium]